MSDKIKNLKLIEERTANHIYECEYEGKEAVVKFVTKAGFHRYRREADALTKGQGFVPDLYFVGDSDILFKGGRCIVMERLSFDYKALRLGYIEFISEAMIGMWELYRRDVLVVPKLRNIAFDKNHKIKWLDFNDDNVKELGYRQFRFADYFGENPSLDFSAVCKTYNKNFCEGGVEDSAKSFYAKALQNYFIPSMYQSLINVHEPIPIKDLEMCLRTETEKKDPNYGKLVKPNRKCYDRWDMIMSTHSKVWWEGKLIRDIGSNIGWFSINMARMGATVIAHEIDKEKGEFTNLIAKQQGLEVKADWDTPLSGGKRANMVLLLSTLNRWVMTDKETKIIGPITSKKDERQKILKILWDHTDELIVEIPNYWIKGAMEGDFVPFMERQGATMRILGQSDNGRNLFYFTRI